MNSKDKPTIRLEIKVKPNASKTEFAGIKNGQLRIRIAAPPEDGKANAELISFMAKTLGCPKKDIILVHGEKSRLKTIMVPAEVKGKLEEIK